MSQHSKTNAKIKSKSSAASTARRKLLGAQSSGQLAIGVDLGDRYSEVCVLSPIYDLSNSNFATE